MRIVWVALVATACGGASLHAATGIDAGSPEMREIDAVVQAWSERSDLPPMNAARLRQLLIVDARTEDEYRRRCPPSLECLTHAGTGLVRPVEAVVVISPDQRRSPGSRLSLIRHGAVHRAAELAGISDPVHRDRRLWGYHCGPRDAVCRAGIVEERAREISAQNN